MKKYIYILLFISSVISAQNKVSISIHQDTRLMILGDNKGNDAGTINILTRFKMQGNQQRLGYMIVFPEFEYAEIDGKYYRYSANIGYTFNNITNIEASLSIGYGSINRYGKSMFSGSGSGELAYLLGNVKLSLIGQLTERKDLKNLWGTNEIRFSGFFGLEINLN